MDAGIQPGLLNGLVFGAEATGPVSDSGLLTSGGVVVGVSLLVVCVGSTCVLTSQAMNRA